MSGTNTIIQAYLNHGGASMNEDDFQKYKLAMLTRWLDTMEIYNLAYESPDKVYNCNGCPEFNLMSVDEAIDHLRVHFPHWFEGGKPARKKSKAAKKG